VTVTDDRETHPWFTGEPGPAGPAPTTASTSWTPPPGATAAAAADHAARTGRVAGPASEPASVVIAGSFVSGRVPLPCGGWVEFHDPHDLKGRDYKRVMRGIRDAGPGHAGASMVDMLDGLIAILVAKWEIPYLPGASLPADNMAITDELRIEDLRALHVAAAPAMKVVFPTESAGRGPGSPTPPASA